MRVELQHVLEETARSLYLTGTVQGEVLTNGDDIQILYLQQLILCVDTGRDTVEVGLLDDTLVAIVTDGEEEELLSEPLLSDTLYCWIRPVRVVSLNQSVSAAGVVPATSRYLFIVIPLRVGTPWAL